MSQHRMCDRCGEMLARFEGFSVDARSARDSGYRDQEPRLDLCSACKIQHDRFMRGALLEGDATETVERPPPEEKKDEG